MALRKLAGLDIATTAIKVAEVEPGANGPRLQHLAWQPLPPDADSPTPLEALRGPGLLKHPNVATVPYPEEPTVEFYKLPELASDKEMLASVRLEVARTHDLAAEDIIVSYDLMGQRAAGSGALRHVMTVCATRDSIETALRGCRRAGLQLQGLDARELALGAVLLANYEFEPNEPAIAVEIGRMRSFLVLMANDEVKFTRRLNVSGQELRDLLQESFEIDEETLSQYVRECQVFPKSEQNLAERNMLSLAAESFAEKLLSEIKLAVDFCLLNLSEDDNVGDLRRLYVSGGSAKLQGLDAYLSDGLGIEVEILDPLRQIEFDFAVLDALGMDQIPEFSVALGLALRKVDAQ